MGYLYDPDNQTYINEAYCDENGYYDSSVLNELSSKVLDKASKKRHAQGDELHNKRQKLEDRAMDVADKKGVKIKDTDEWKQAKDVGKKENKAYRSGNNLAFGSYKAKQREKANNESASLFSFDFK